MKNNRAIFAICERAVLFVYMQWHFCRYSAIFVGTVLFLRAQRYLCANSAIYVRTMLLPFLIF